jgi:heparanase 1
MFKSEGCQVLRATLLLFTCTLGSWIGAHSQTPTLSPSSLPKIGTVDERFQSYNIEMVEVTGGRFWKPYDQQVDAILAAQAAGQKTGTGKPTGMDPALYQYRTPINLSNPRLRKLAGALGPAYLRVSGTWQNSTYFLNSDDPSPSTPPKGFNSVLTRQQWKGVVDFAHSSDAKIVTSFATSVGTRDAAGVWTPEQAHQFLAYTKSIGGSIAAVEFMNEPTFAEIGGAPKGYSAADYGRDIAVFVPFIRREAPFMILLGPGSVGEGASLGAMRLLKSEDLLTATGPVFDAFSYHFYGAVSNRCASLGGGKGGTTPELALSDEWLSKTNTVEAFYAGLRDHFMPGKPIWNTETAQAACGGDRWAASFIDSFRYLSQLGSLAKHGVQVVAHNTLAASDYGLIDEKTLNPRPNYWAALLWRQLMGTTVLDAGASPSENLHLYAHCMRGRSGGVVFLAINADRIASQSMQVPQAGDQYMLTAKNLLDHEVQLNGSTLSVGGDDSLPKIVGVASKAGVITFAPASITFLALPKANNQSCH